MKNNFLVKFWRGDIKLWISYWIFGVLLAYPIFFSDLFLATKFNIPVGILGFAYAMFWCIGTWRAAKKYTGKPRWADLTKFVILLNVIAFFGLFVASYVFSLMFALINKF